MTFIQNNVPHNLQRLTGYLIVLLIAGLTLSSFAFVISYLASAKNESNQVSPKQINVTGEGKVAIKPDIALFTTAVVTQSTEIGTAQSENTRRLNEVLAYLKSNGVEEKDLKTIGYSINPQYQFDSRPCIQVFPSPCPQNPPRIVSYEVRHTIEVKVRDLNKIDDLLAGVVEKGANEVSSIQFDVDDKEKVLRDARKKAIENAKAKAEILAKDLGVRLTKIVAFSESSGGPIFGRSLEALGKEGDLGGAVAPAPQIEPGEQEIRSFVNVVYEFR